MLENRSFDHMLGLLKTENSEIRGVLGEPRSLLPALREGDDLVLDRIARSNGRAGLERFSHRHPFAEIVEKDRLCGPHAGFAEHFDRVPELVTDGRHYVPVRLTRVDQDTEEPV